MSLYVKMAQIMGQIRQLDKDARMDAGTFSYKFVSDASVYHTVRQLMVEHGIALFASMTAVEQERFVTGTDKYGNEKDKWHTRARFEFTLVDSESGETNTCTWFAESEDSADKGVNKCATAALKYWLLKTFIIPTGDDPDAANGAGQPSVNMQTAMIAKAEEWMGEMGLSDANVNAALKTGDWRTTPLATETQRETFKATVNAYIAAQTENSI